MAAGRQCRCVIDRVFVLKNRSIESIRGREHGKWMGDEIKTKTSRYFASLHCASSAVCRRRDRAVVVDPVLPLFRVRHRASGICAASQISGWTHLAATSLIGALEQFPPRFDHRRDRLVDWLPVWVDVCTKPGGEWE